MAIAGEQGLKDGVGVMKLSSMTSREEVHMQRRKRPVEEMGSRISQRP